MSNMYIALNGWQEVLARILVDFPCQENVSPAWLVNPATKRRLKLDRYYPDAALAIRFVGLKAKGQGRQSDWDLQEEEQRDETRVELCRAQGVSLLLLDPLEETVKQLDHLLRLLTRASRLLAQGDRPLEEKLLWQPRLSHARQQAEELRSRIARNPEQMMATLAESWRDREVGGVTQVPEPLPMPATTAPLPPLSVGRRVHHARFGPGVITELEGSGADAKITILFDGEQPRTFLASLVADKLSLAP
jgi:hypothetical protein